VTAEASADAPSALLLLRLDSMAGATTAAASTGGFNSCWTGGPASVVTTARSFTHDAELNV
jgi:hypothetical protein